MDDHDKPSPPVELSQTDLPQDIEPRPYAIEGQFLEVCDCFTICPCWSGRAPDGDACAGVFAWLIEAGTIDGVDVSGLVVASISTHEGHRDAAHQRVVLFLDQRSSAEQATNLAPAFAGIFGGPLGELRTILGELLAVERAAITVETVGRRTTLDIGLIIHAESVDQTFPPHGPVVLENGRLASVLGPRAQVGVAERFRAGMPGRGIDIDVRQRSAMRGKFRYQFQPPSS
jgi:hypothetical protein